MDLIAGEETVSVAAQVASHTCPVLDDAGPVVLGSEAAIEARIKSL
jgi:hypothetical protein